MASVESKVFAVTGGASGIGAATCRLLARRGAAAVCIGDKSMEGLESIRHSILQMNPATRVEVTVLDITSSTEVATWLSQVVSTHGDLHGAANIAGIAQGGGLRDTPAIVDETDEEWARVMKVNLDGTFYCTRAEVSAMQHLPRADRTIVNVTSIAAFYHMPDVFAYGTSKGAAAYLTNCVAADVMPLGIRVNAVSPGVTRTPLLPRFKPKAASLQDIEESYREEGFLVTEPEDVARTIVWLLSDDSRPVYGANINVGASAP